MHRPQLSTKQCQDVRFVSWNINGDFLNKISILMVMLLNNGLMCVQAHLLVRLSFLDMSRDFHTFLFPQELVHFRGRPSEGLATYVPASLFSSSDPFLTVRVGSCEVINLYLPNNYKNDE